MGLWRIPRAGVAAGLAGLLFCLGAGAVQTAAQEKQPTDQVSQPAKITAAILSALDKFSRQSLGTIRIDFNKPLVPIQQGNQVLIPFRKLRVMDLQNGHGLELGDLMLAVTPGKGGNYGFTAKLPPLINALDKGRKVIGTVALGSHSLSGSWSADHQIMTAIDGTFGGIRLRALDQALFNTEVTIGSVTLTGRNLRKGSGLWDGTFDYRLSDLKTVPNKGKLFKISGIRMVGRVEGFDNEGFRKLGNVVKPGAAAGSVTVDPSQASRIAGIMEALKFGVGEVEMSVDHILLTEWNRTVFSLGAASWRMGFDGSRALGKMQLALSAERIEAEADMPELVPQRITLKMSFDRLPMKQLLATFFRSFAAQKPGGKIDAVPLDTAKLQGLMFQARPSMTLEDLAAETRDAKFAFSGGITVDPKAASLVFGGFDGTIAGLANILRSTALHGKTNKNALTANAMLAAVKGYGQPELAPDGVKFLYKYRIKVHRDGRITVNDILLNPAPPGRKN